MDLIDRQAAIDAIENTDCELTPSAWNELTDAIMQVPSAQPEQRWIPCSERLPKKNGEYLVTEINSLTRDCLIDIAHYGDWIQENSGFYKANEVIAWMPLPEPYVEGRTDEAD